MMYEKLESFGLDRTAKCSKDYPNSLGPVIVKYTELMQGRLVLVIPRAKLLDTITIRDYNINPHGDGAD